MLKEIQEHPLTIDVDVGMEGYESMAEMVDDATEKGCDALVNCTGLGSSKLCNDDTLIGGRGILLHYERNCARNIDDDSMEHDAAILTEDGPWGSSTNPVYIIPRGDVNVVGGTYYEGGTETTLTDDERKRLVQNASILGIDTTAASPVGEWAGFRPVRKTAKMEIDEELSVKSGVKVLHSYGYGGSGWTVYTGVAKDSVKMLGLNKDAN
jgi:D-amino-acid oxidase